MAKTPLYAPNIPTDSITHVNQKGFKMLEELAREYARKIHWSTNRKPDAYEQEAEARTTKLLLEAFEIIEPTQKPYRIL